MDQGGVPWEGGPAEESAGPRHRRIDFALVVLVDRQGWLLMQERDEHAPVDPEKWSFCGGAIEPGETVEQGAYRELAEETGVILTDGLAPIGEYTFVHPELRDSVTFALFAGSTTLTDADIVCREGRRIVFVHPVVARCLDLAAGTAECLESYLDSDHYRAVADVA